MGSSPQSPPPDPLALTPRRRRLRAWTALILIAIIAMIVCGKHSPFFVLPTGPVAPAIRRAVAVRALLILLYWTACMFLGIVLALLAWLEVREIRSNVSSALRSAWRESAGRRRGERNDGQKH